MAHTCSRLWSWHHLWRINIIPDIMTSDAHSHVPNATKGDLRRYGESGFGGCISWNHNIPYDIMASLTTSRQDPRV